MTTEENETLHRLEALLRDRIAEAERGEVVEDSVERIFAAVRSEPEGWHNFPRRKVRRRSRRTDGTVTGSPDTATSGTPDPG